MYATPDDDVDQAVLINTKNGQLPLERLQKEAGKILMRGSLVAMSFGDLANRNRKRNERVNIKGYFSFIYRHLRRGIPGKNSWTSSYFVFGRSVPKDMGGWQQWLY